MTEAVKRQPGVSGLSLVLSAWHDQYARIFNIDLFTVLIAILLPWSTSGVVIVAILWFMALIPSLEIRPFLRSLLRPVCVLPIAFFALSLVGTLWSDAPWAERLYAVGPTAKLLMLPLLFYHFERTTRAAWIFVAFLVSCTLLTVLSWVVAFAPELSLKTNFSPNPVFLERGIFVKNYIDQSQEFTLCLVAVAYPIMTFLRAKKFLMAALLIALVLNFFANMALVVVSRTALVTIPFMLAVFALLHLRWRVSLAIFCAAIAVSALAWTSSSQLQQRTSMFLRDYELYKEINGATSIGLRLEFWKKSLRFVAEAPVVGHGTGSIRGLFERVAAGQGGATAEIVSNPHNQTLNVAVQWGIIGVVVLYAMWFLHLMLFRGEGLVAWIGLLVVVQNICTSLFNSHLFDFHEGWMYVIGVGVAGGTILGQRPAPAELS
jgi:O-antigen ligase